MCMHMFVYVYTQEILKKRESVNKKKKIPKLKKDLNFYIKEAFGESSQFRENTHIYFRY